MGDINLSGSFIIGSFLLLTLLNMILNFNTQSNEITASRYAATSSIGVNELLKYDFESIGYRVTSSTKIKMISNNKIKFLADLENNGVIDTITYMGDKISGDSVVLRIAANTLSSDTTFIKAHKFNIVGYNTKHDSLLKFGALYFYNSAEIETYDINKVKAVKISFVMDFSEMNVRDEYKTRYYIRKRFYPKNI